MIAEELRNEVISLRRKIHMYPELGFEEYRTSQLVEDYLHDIGIKTWRIGKTGVVGEIDNGGYKRVALRADMDALPIQEENDVPYKSQVPGVMHACGHDAHTAMLLVAARVLSSTDFEGKLRFIFQPAEEGLNGALTMVEGGAIDGVDSILGVHVWADLPTGTFAIEPGPVMASVDRFKVRVHGHGGHGASPHETNDPVVCASSIIVALQTIVSRNVDPLKSAVVTVGKIQGGTAFNIIPETVEFEGTVRSFEDETHLLVQRRIEEITKSVAMAHGCSAELDYKIINHATVNDGDLAAMGVRVASKIARVVEDEKNMGGEDFSEYASRIPGLFAFLGVRNESKGIVHPHHSPRFDLDEEALPLGVEFEVRMAMEMLKN